MCSLFFKESEFVVCVGVNMQDFTFYCDVIFMIDLNEFSELLWCGLSFVVSTKQLKH